jgi:hypothetical protein
LSASLACAKKDSYPIELNTPSIFDQKLAYIHNNLVVAGLVSEPKHYLLSSAPPQGRCVNGYE